MAKRYIIEGWESVSRARGWPYLLVGNGASCAISNGFSYKSLVSVAGLDDDDLRLFKSLGTVNFEAVLDYLRVAAIICEQLRHDENDVYDRYDRIRDALITAINDHHIAWTDIPDGPLERYRGVLLDHEATWCTSYDLLSYWAVMADSPRGTKRIGDCFWTDDGAFDPTNAQPNRPMPMIYWVHGALHLYRVRSGANIKRTHEPGRSLLDLLETAFRGIEMPLFVAEGTARQKMSAIRSSEYLSHAYTTLAQSAGNIVIFGQSLGPSDSHLVEAINENARRHIAYGVYEQRVLQRNQLCAEVEAAFPHSTVHFFDSRTHPLGK